MVLIGQVARMRQDGTRAPALFFRSRLYEGFEAAAALADQAAQTLGSAPAS